MSILSGHARVAGIAGWPVTYSRSPRLHGFWLQRHGIDGAYIPLPIRPGMFAPAVRGLLAAGFAGANVTIPHKLAAFDVCDAVDDSARRAGAVNTLVFRDDRISGSNTDGYGFIANLRGHGVDPAAGPALLLGAGGSARAVAAALLDAGAPVTVANRTRGRADALARDLPGLCVAEWDARVAALADHALVVNTTPLGMVGHEPLALDLSHAQASLVVAMGMTGISKSQVSRLCVEIDDKIGAFLDRPLEGDWPYLWLDAENCVGLALSGGGTTGFDLDLLARGRVTPRARRACRSNS